MLFRTYCQGCKELTLHNERGPAPKKTERMVGDDGRLVMADCTSCRRTKRVVRARMSPQQPVGRRECPYGQGPEAQGG